MRRESFSPSANRRLRDSWEMSLLLLFYSIILYYCTWKTESLATHRACDASRNINIYNNSMLQTFIDICTGIMCTWPRVVFEVTHYNIILRLYFRERFVETTRLLRIRLKYVCDGNTFDYKSITRRNFVRNFMVMYWNRYRTRILIKFEFAIKAHSPIRMRWIHTLCLVFFVDFERIVNNFLTKLLNNNARFDEKPQIIIIS